MDTEKMNTRQESSVDGTVGSPTLEALYHDLDMFINELNLSSDQRRSSDQVNQNVSLKVTI
jgi:hypothetical protein